MSDLISKAKVCNYIKACVNPYGEPFGGTTCEFGLKIMEYVENSECDKILEEHDKKIQSKAISNFAEWCYINGIDFSYMSTSDKSGRQFIDDVIARYCKEQMKEVGE